MSRVEGAVSHHELELAELRADRELAVEYLKAAMESLDNPDDRAAGLLALRTVAEAYGAYLGQAGHSNRSLVLIDADGVVEWVHETATPLDIPGPDLIVEAIRA